MGIECLPNPIAKNPSIANENSSLNKKNMISPNAFEKKFPIGKGSYGKVFFNYLYII